LRERRAEELGGDQLFPQPAVPKMRRRSGDISSRERSWTKGGQARERCSCWLTWAWMSGRPRRSGEGTPPPARPALRPREAGPRTRSIAREPIALSASTIRSDRGQQHWSACTRWSGQRSIVESSEARAMDLLELLPDVVEGSLDLLADALLPVGVALHEV